MTDVECKPTMQIGPRPLIQSLKHGVELWNDESTPTFRLDQRGGRDGFTRYVNARIEGKVGEVAFVQFLDEYYDIEAAVDFRIYGDIDETDDGDIQYVVGDDGEHYEPSVNLDVKKTKTWNDWLCLRTDVLDRHPDDAPFVLTRLAIEDDIVLDEWEGESWETIVDDLRFEDRLSKFVHEQCPVHVEMTGVAYPDEFTEEFDQGDRLYDPESGQFVGGPLRRDNVAVPCDNLDASPERWDRVVDEITRNIPVEYEPLDDE